MKLLLQTRQLQRLSAEALFTLEQKWDEIVSRSNAFVPHEKEKETSYAEVITRNIRLGEFASLRLKRMFARSTEEQKTRRWRAGKIVVAVGFGRGYDSEWLRQAILAGYQVCWIDVSGVACEMAKASMDWQWKNLTADTKIEHPNKPRVIKGEIESILINPNDVGLDISKVEVWYFCRTLTCISRDSAQVVLGLLGELSLSKEVDPARNNSIEIVAALRDHNRGRVGKTSQLYFERELLAYVRQGIGSSTEIEAVKKSSVMYFDQLYTAFTIRAS